MNNQSLTVTVEGRFVRVTFLAGQPHYAEVAVSRGTRTIWHRATKRPLVGLAKAAFAIAQDAVSVFESRYDADDNVRKDW